MKREIETYTVFDVETPNRYNNEMCSIGIVRVIDGFIDEKLHFYVRPQGGFERTNIRIHGIRPQDVADAPDFGELWPRIREYFEGRILLAHNATFDLSVLRSSLKREGIFAPSFSYLCTHRLARQVFPGWESYSLANLSARLGVELIRHHDALEDALAAQEIFEHMRRRQTFSERNLKRYGEVDELLLDAETTQRALLQLHESMVTDEALQDWLARWEIYSDAYPLSHLLWILSEGHWDEEKKIIVLQWMREPYQR